MTDENTEAPDDVQEAPKPEDRKEIDVGVVVERLEALLMSCATTKEHAAEGKELVEMIGGIIQTLWKENVQRAKAIEGMQQRLLLYNKASEALLGQLTDVAMKLCSPKVNIAEVRARINALLPKDKVNTKSGILLHPGS